MHAPQPPTAVGRRLADAFGPIGSLRALGGTAWLVQAGRRQLVTKVGPGAQDEADGLRLLGAVRGGPPVPDVVLVEADLLVTTAVERAPRTPGHDESLGRGLARLHQTASPHWGGGSSWVGACPVDPADETDARTFYGNRLVDLARRCTLEQAVEPLAARLATLLPPGGPVLVHGDLWWGNVLFAPGDVAWLVDPSVHGGHGEEDLAMLALFGAVPRRLFDAYTEVQPLRDGWRERVALFQLAPLLVHAALFGGAYRAQAEAMARRYA